jgi:hypothetical protein
MYVTPQMGLTTWDIDTDGFDHTALLNDFIIIDGHNHTPGKGAPLTIDSIPILDSTKLGPCSVTSIQLCDGSVINAKLATPAVKEANIYDDAVTRQKIADNAVGSAQIAASAVDTSELADGSVTEPKVASGAITNPKISEGAVNTPKIADQSVTTSKVADSNITTPKLANKAVTNAVLDDNSVSTSKVQDDTITAPKLAEVPAVYLTIDHEHVVAPNEFHLVQWDNQRYDNFFNSMWDFSRRGYILIGYPGIYLITASIMWSEGGAGGNTSGRRARIRHNNTPITGEGPITPLKDDPGDGSAPYRVRHSLATQFNCVNGDKLDVLVQQTAGANQRIIPDGFTTNFAATWIAPLPS